MRGAALLLSVLFVTEALNIFNVDLNLNWLRMTEFGHPAEHQHKGPEQRVELMAQVFDQLNYIARYGPPGPCDSCKASLGVLQRALNNESVQLDAKENPSEAQIASVSSLFYGICSHPHPPQGIRDMFKHICEDLHLYQSTTAANGFSFLPDFANAVREIDAEGIDGNYLCHYMFSNACPRPDTPLINYSQYWPAKPEGPKQHKRSNTTIKVLHVSDVHLSSNYTEFSAANCLGAMCCDNFALPNPLEEQLAAPKYGFWRCDAPQALLDSAIANSASYFDSGYAFALFTGDMVDHNPLLITREDTELEEERTLYALKHHLGNIPVFPVLGNHDTFPYSQEPPGHSQYANRTHLNLELMEHLWSRYGWLGDDAIDQVKVTHGAYAVEPVDGLKVITLNSNYWYRWNFYNYVGMADPDPSGIVKFLVAELDDCEKRGIHAWVQGHVSPGGLPDEALPPAASFLVATFERYTDTISGLFFGHTHLDEFSVVYANNATERAEAHALNAVWIAPSITPYTDLNPGWRYYEVDSNTFEIMDSVTVMADIEPGFGMAWPATPDLAWKELYSARDTYGKDIAWPESEPLNGRFWHRVATEFLSNPMFSRDFVQRSYRDSSRAPNCLDYGCRAERYCYATSMTPDQVYQCHELFHAGSRLKPQKHPWLGNHKWSYSGIPKFPMPRADRLAGRLLNRND